MKYGANEPSLSGAALLKGRANYLCRYRLGRNTAHGYGGRLAAQLADVSPRIVPATPRPSWRRACRSFWPVAGGHSCSSPVTVPWRKRRWLAPRWSFPLLVRGEAPRTELLRRFRTGEVSVLLGTQSFWEGVDVRGEALSLVVIDKLPFVGTR